MLKFSILNNPIRAAEQSEVMLSLGNPLNCRRPPVALLKAWLNKDWSEFRKVQKRTFSALWKDMQQNGLVRMESDTRIEVDLTARSIRSGWCWADNCLALLAFREGAEVINDELWFPASALDIGA